MTSNPERPTSSPPSAEHSEASAGGTHSSTSPVEQTAITERAPDGGSVSDATSHTMVLNVVEGAVLGVYRLEKKLGEGGMGAVWKAFHTKLKKYVALKVLPAHLLRDAKLVSRFEREMEAVGRLDHPAIVRAMDAGEVQGTHYLVMEYVDGQDLGQLVKTRGARKVSDACEMIRQAAIGLAYAHKNGLVHRDVKPSNLFLTKDGKVKILDLGLARLQGDNLAADPGAGLTGTGQVLGTPDYMAPEQWENTHTVGPACDLYALGCTLFYLLTGRAPFGDDKHQTLPRKMMGHVNEAPPELSAVRTTLLARAKKPAQVNTVDSTLSDESNRAGNPSAAAIPAPSHDIPPELESIYQRLLAKEPKDRFATADELAVALLAVIKGKKPASSDPTIDMSVGPASNQSPPQPPTVPQFTAFDQLTPVSRPARPPVPPRSKTLAALGGLGAVLLLGVILITIKNRDGSTTKIEVDESSEINISRKGDTETSPSGTRTGWHGWPANAPKPAIAPFDAAQAKRHQEEWAKYLNVPVEYTNSIRMKFRLIPPGEFEFGGNQADIDAVRQRHATNEGYLATEQPAWEREVKRHRVIVSRPFYLGMHEVTQGQFQSVLRRNPSSFVKNSSDTRSAEKVAGISTDELPVENVTNEDIAAFCKQLNLTERIRSEFDVRTLGTRAGQGTAYSLPSEAEWEFACRGGTTTTYWSGDRTSSLGDYEWHNGNSAGCPHPAGQLKPNPFGIFDIGGNVAEWVDDRWSSDFFDQFVDRIAIDPLNRDTRSKRVVIRGGHWGVDDVNCRSSVHLIGYPEHSSYTTGFRIAFPVRGVRQLLKVDGPAIPQPNAYSSVALQSSNDSGHGWPSDAPKPAIAPFDAKQAKRHQEEWAKHLGTSVVTTNSVGAKMVLIPPGEFLMGSSDAQLAAPFVAASSFKDEFSKSERPQHRVTLTKPFLMGATEVTIGEFKQFVAATGYQTEAEQSSADPRPLTYLTPEHVVTDASPVTYLTWNDALAYCGWLSGVEKVRYRLPTEAEWEFACRAGTSTQFSFGDDPTDIDPHALSTATDPGFGRPADERLPNRFGVRGMHGGAFEWCQDVAHAGWYQVSPAIDPSGPGSGSQRMRRGGYHEHAASARSAARWPGYVQEVWPGNGFRIVRELVPATMPDLPVPQLAISDVTKSFSGLFNELPALPGVKRWNVETRYARGHGTTCWSPDSKFVAAVSGRQLRIYSAPDLKLVRILPEYREWIGEIAWSPDGKWIAGIDGTRIRLHDPHTGAAGPVLSGHIQVVSAIAWSADSQTLATGSAWSENIWLWSVDGTPLKRLTGPGPRRLVPHPKLPLLAGEDGAGKLSVWDLESGKLQIQSEFTANDTAWSGDGRLFFRNESSKIQFWKPSPGASPVELKYPWGTQSFRVRPGTRHLIVNERGEVAHAIDQETGEYVSEAFYAPGLSLWNFSPDGRWFISGGEGEVGHHSLTIIAVRKDSGVPLNSSLLGFRQLAWNPKSDTLATDFGAASRSRMIGCWNLGNVPRWHQFGPHSGGHLSSLVWEPDGRLLLSDSGMDGKSPRLWDASTGTIKRTLATFEKQASSEVASAAYSSDGQLLALAGSAKIVLFDAKTYELKDILSPHPQSNHNVRWIGSGPVLLEYQEWGRATRSWNREKQVWEKAYPETLGNSPFFSPGGRWGLLERGDRLDIVELPSGPVLPSEKLPQGRQIYTYGGNGRAWLIAFSADSERFAVMTDRAELATYDRNGKSLNLLSGENGHLYFAEFAPDGSPRLAAVGNDHTLRVWNTDTGKQLWCGVQLSPDEAALLNDQGEVVFGDPTTVECELIYLIEYDDGRTAVLTPSQFKERFPRPKTDNSGGPNEK